MARSAFRPWLASLIATLLLLIVAVAPVGANPSPAAVANGVCPVTPYATSAPAGPETQLSSGESFTLTWYGNDALWAGLDRAYQGRWFTDGIKVLWVRIASGSLSVEGHRLDGTAPPLRADIPDGYGPQGIQASGLIFPTPGCWQVTGHVAERELRFVVEVHPRTENPVNGGVPAPGPDLWASIRRPLRLPSLAAGAVCPRPATQRVNGSLGEAAGSGPAFALFGGNILEVGKTATVQPAGWWGGKILWMTDASYRGPVLIRGGRIDAPGQLLLEGGAQTTPQTELHLLPSEAAAVVTPQGTLPPTGGWTSWPWSARSWPSTVAVPRPGCYAFQIDGWSFSEVIVVPVVAA